MADADWGTDQWDVDVSAESLNKALFGKRRKTGNNGVKPDSDVSNRNGVDLGEDSGDEDGDKLSKKAKKKLKERRRKENMKNKKKEGDEDNHTDNDVGNAVGKKPKAKSSNLTDKKKKCLKDDSKLKTKATDVKMLNGKKEFNKSNDRKLSMKEKKMESPSILDDDEEDGSKAKRMKTAEEAVEQMESPNTQKEVGAELNVKKRRKKKKKPSSKKNKYKHLDLKRKKATASDSDDEKDVDQSQKDTIKSNTDLVAVSEKSSKRKRSTSPEMSIKKPKLLKESCQASPILNKKEKKQKKTLDILGKDKVEEKKSKKQKKENGDKCVNDKEAIVSSGKPAAGPLGNKQENERNSKISKKEKKERKSKNVIDNSAKEEIGKISTTDTISPFFSSKGMEQQQKCKDKLVSGRFRFINEQLYTIKGDEAFRMFQKDKSLMDAYNTGFQSQVKQWPTNPLDVVIKQLGNKPSNLKVADFGCGEARLSASVPQKVVHSLDLHALNERVTVCNMARTPLNSESVDIAVFCLSLMGTNLNDYLLEANRVLKEGGILKIAEVVSRFTDMNHFINGVSSMGFKCVNSRDLSKMFYLMDFKKVKGVKKSSKQIKALTLIPCVYKKR